MQKLASELVTGKKATYFFVPDEEPAGQLGMHAPRASPRGRPNTPA